MNISVLNLLMSSTCFEPDGSSSGRRLCIQLWCGAFYMHQYKQSVGRRVWARQRSWYSDWLRAGRSGDRIPVGARFSAPVQTSPGAHPASCTMGTGSFPGVKSDRGVTLTPHPLLVPLVMKEQSYTSTPPVGRTACTEPQCCTRVQFTFFLGRRVGSIQYRSILYRT